MRWRRSRSPIRRARTFFRSELKQLFLLHAADVAIRPTELMGSYAGAMGWGQFMPSSIANFARDYDRRRKSGFVEFAAGHLRQRRQLFRRAWLAERRPVAVRAEVAADARAHHAGRTRAGLPAAAARRMGLRARQNDEARSG